MTATTALETCGNYLLLERIGSGGMAEVFRAKTVGFSGFQRIVAIKKILPVLAEDKRFISMFVDEARIAVELTHAHIVQIYELGISEGEYYIAMEYVHGRDLRQVMKDLGKKGRNVPVPVAAYIASCVCSAIDFAHRKATLDGQPLNIVHRDVSPPNVLLGFDGSVKVADFGIALAKDRVSNTMGSKLKGKIAYMSPEQAWGHDLDRRSDIYSAGTMLFEMLTGQLPYPGGGNNFELLDRVREADVRSPRELNAGIPLELEGIVLKALRGERTRRYSWASDMAEELQPILIHGRHLFGSKDLGAFVKSIYGEAAASEEVHLQTLLAEAESELLAVGADPIDWSHVDATQIVELDASHDTVILAMNPPWASDTGRVGSGEQEALVRSEVTATSKNPVLGNELAPASAGDPLGTTTKSPVVDPLATTTKSPVNDPLGTTTKSPAIDDSPPASHGSELAAMFEDPLAETDRVDPVDDRVTARVPAIPEGEAIAAIAGADETMVTAEVEPISETEALAAIGSAEITRDERMVTIEVPEVAEAIIARGTLKVDLGDHLEDEISQALGTSHGEQLEPPRPTSESAALAEESAAVSGRRTTEAANASSRRRRGVGWVGVALVLAVALTGAVYLAHEHHLLPAWAAALVERISGRTTRAAPGSARPHPAKSAVTKKAKTRATGAKEPRGGATPVESSPTGVIEKEPEAAVAQTSRADVLKLRKAFLAALRAKGIIRGDDTTLDEQRTALKRHYMEGAWAAALQDGERAQETLAAIDVDERFLKRKLGRLRRRSARAGAESRDQIDALAAEIESLVTDGELATANSRLNDAFQLLRGPE